MSGRSWGRIINQNIVLLTSIPLIIGIHWGWWRIQQNTDLVDPKDRRELPIYSMYKDAYSKLFGPSLIEEASNAEPRQRVEE